MLSLVFFRIRVGTEWKPTDRTINTVEILHLEVTVEIMNDDDNFIFLPPIINYKGLSE